MPRARRAPLNQPRRPGGHGTAGGSCEDILAHGCDGLTGDKLAGCKADIQNAFDECVKAAECEKQRDAVLAQCAPKDVACIAKADQVFADCFGPPPPNPPPGK